MKTTVETVDPVKRKLSVEVEPKRVKQAFDRAARELAKQVSLPGFRPGKAPRRLLEQRFGSGVIAQEAAEDALTEYYVEALEQEDLDPVAMPEIDVKHFDESEGCAFEATVEVRPSFDVPDHEGIAVTFPEWDVTDEDVAEQVDELRDRFAEVDEVERPADTGDFVTLDLTVTVGGEELEDSAVTDALYEVGSGGVTPKLDDELVGVEAGDSFTYDDVLPDEYPQHGGEEATFTVSVTDVRARTLPDDEDLAAAQGFDSYEELERDLRDGLLRRRINQAQHDVRGRILEAYLAQIDVPLPPSMVSQEAEARISQIERQAEQYGLDMDELLGTQQTTREEFETTAREQAEASVKARLVLDELARKLGVEVEAEDLNAEIVRHAQASGLEPRQIANLIQQEGTAGALVGDVLRRKSIDAIADAATVEGAPAQDVLVELGLAPDPAAGADEDQQDEEEQEQPSGLIVPGQAGEQRSAGGLIVPGGAQSGG